jgi:hypothetical protein
MPRCDTCRFWDIPERPKWHGLDHGGHPDDRQGFCRRNAPVTLESNFRYDVLQFLSIIAWETVGDTEKAPDIFDSWENDAHCGQAHWPATRGSDWCGKHEPKGE